MNDSRTIHYFCFFFVAVGFFNLGVTHAIQQSHTHEHDHSHGVQALRPAHLYAPSVMPDRIILSLNQDPQTTVTVNWRTSVGVEVGLAEIALADDGPNFVDNARQFKATTQALKSDLSTAHYHTLTFKNLKPEKIYAYRVGDGTNWSEWIHARTTSATSKPFSFIYFGDAQNNVRSMWSRIIREAQRDAPKAAFIVHAGDLINNAESDAQWGEWFGAGGWLNAMIPSVAVPGNHEYLKKSGKRKVSHHWNNVFAFPENGPRGLEETCYTVTYQNLRLIALNSNELQQEQAEWMDRILTENESKWVVCAFHHPIFSTGSGRDNAKLRKLWKPIFDKHKVDLVIQGHDHTYGRTGLNVPSSESVDKDFKAAEEAGVKVGDQNSATGLTNVDTDSGTVYVVSVSGPKMYNNTRFDFMKRVAEDTQLYQIIRIDGGKLTFEARTAIGRLYDKFELHKVEGETNRLVETGTLVPQNLRSKGPQD